MAILVNFGTLNSDKSGQNEAGFNKGKMIIHFMVCKRTLRVWIGSYRTHFNRHKKPRKKFSYKYSQKKFIDKIVRASISSLQRNLRSWCPPAAF